MVKIAIHKRASGSPWALPGLLAGAALVAGCSLAPEYKVPPSPVAAHYRTIGPWVDAHPSDQLSRDGWWKNREGQKTFLAEWEKTVATWFGI